MWFFKEKEVDGGNGREREGKGKKRARCSGLDNGSDDFHDISICNG